MPVSSPSTRVKELENTLSKVYKLSKGSKSGNKIRKLVKTQLTTEKICQCCGHKSKVTVDSGVPDKEVFETVKSKKPIKLVHHEHDSSDSDNVPEGYLSSDSDSNSIASLYHSSDSSYSSDSGDSGSDSSDSYSQESSPTKPKSERELFGVVDEHEELQGRPSERELFGVDSPNHEENNGDGLTKVLSEEQLFGGDFKQQKLFESSSPQNYSVRVKELEKRMALLERGMRNVHVNRFV